MARPEQKLQAIKERQDRYLAGRQRYGTLVKACRYARVSPHTVYAWRDENQANGYIAAEFLRLEKQAHSEYCDLLEAEAHRRGVQGVREPVYYQGKVVGHIRRYSDTLLLAKLNANMPEKYGRNRTEVSGPGGGPIQVAQKPDLSQLSDEELVSLESILAKTRDPDTG